MMKTKKWYLSILLVFFLGLRGFSQGGIIINPVNPTGIFTFEDLWQIDIILTGTSQFEQYYINLDLYEINRGKILAAKSSLFRLTQNVMNISKANLSLIQPILTTFYSDITYANLVSSGGYFPPGTYNVHLRLIGLSPGIGTGTIEEELAQASYSQKVDFLLPPELIYVFDRDTLSGEEKYPMFLWTPPVPVDAYSDVKYTLRLTEIYPGQTPYQAIRSNPEILNVQQLEENSFTYPSTAMPLKDKTDYAWYVTADVGGTPVSSDVYKFTYIEQITSRFPKARVVAYTDLNFSPNGSFYCAYDKTIYIRYFEEYQVKPDKVLSYKLFNYKRELIAGVDNAGVQIINPSPVFPIKTGTNYLEMNFSSVNGFNYGAFYYLEVYNEKNEVWYLRVFPYSSISGTLPLPQH